MEIGGPFLDRAKKRRGSPKYWYLRYTAPKKNPDETAVLDGAGRPVMQRYRPYYESKALAEADMDRIREQHETTGSGDFLFNRDAAADYDAAKKIVGEVPLVDVAKFWRLHHPETPKEKLAELAPKFLKDVEERLGQGRHYSDLKSRIGQFINPQLGNFGNRYPETVTRQEILDYVRNIPDASPRTKRNHKTAVCVFFNWLLDRQLVAANPAAGIKKRMLPREVRKEIEFLSLDRVTRYLRAAERYDPDLVAHEIVQLIAGVRADDEMADFSAEFVHPKTKEIVIPAAIAKTEAREVIDGVEDNFWAWWKEYGPEHGLLRPKNHGPRWDRIRVLASMESREEADKLARLPIKHLLRQPEIRELRERAPWPWNARRRTFCTYHIAKHQSAAKTALIMRHRGSSYTLHNSYRGLGVTQAEGAAYFEIMPQRVAHPIRPEVVLRGAVLGKAQAAA